MDKTQPINNLYPHYTNDYFKTPRTTYIADGRKTNRDGYVKGAEYNYNDRLRQWDYDKSDKAWEVAKTSGFDPYSAAFHEAYLKAYYGKDLELVHILSSFNWSNGYPYIVYGVIFKEESETDHD